MTSYHDYEGAEYEYPPHEEEPMTNEEWLRSCTTEQLAEWINNIVDDGIIKAWMIKNNCCGDYLESVKWWLKQPHSEVGK